MAQFQGFTCDVCGKVIEPRQRTKRTVRLEGAQEGDYHEDLCPDCTVVPEHVELKPIPRRKKPSAQGDPAPAADDQDVPAGVGG